MQNGFLSIIMLLAISFPPKKAETYKNIVVLELFTSQGCSSCPPADALLHAVKNNYSKDQVIALSYHVDYWNYIGWKDPFSKKVFSNKQRAYSRKFYNSTVYTPQIVVNGKEHFVGSDKALMQTKLNAYLKTSSDNKVVISRLKKEKTTINFDYEILGTTKNKKVRALLVINEKLTTVKRGENSNRTLKNSNIVVAESYLNSVDGKGAISIPELVSEKDKLTLIVLVENSELDILGGSQMAVN